MKGAPNGLAAGIFWWGTEYQTLPLVNEAGFNTASFFDGAGNVLPAAGVFGQMDAPLALRASLTGSSVAVSWPLSGAGMTLTTTTGLAPDAFWSPVNSPVQNTGTIFETTLPLSNGVNRFYRLQSH
jgi:hypothetical protein